MWWGRCKRYVKETRWGVKWNLGGGASGASGQAGGEVSPSQRLADKTLLYLDIVQHYYCTQALEAEKQARKARDEKEGATFTARQIEMQKKRDEVFGTLTNLAIKMKEPEALTEFLREQGEKLLGYGKGITEKDVINRLEILQSAYATLPTMAAKGIDTGGGDITTQGGPAVGTIEGKGPVAVSGQVRDIYQGPTTIIQQTSPELEERVRKLEETVRGLSPSPPKEEIEKQMDALRMQLTARDLENSRLHLELGLKELEDKRYEDAINDFQEALRPLPEGSEASASVLWNLGMALIEWPRGDRSENLNRAIEVYKKVLTIYTREKSPERFAGAQNNLGNAYWGLSGVRDKEANLTRAIECFKEALKVRTKEALPWYFVATSGNLAMALSMKGDIAGVLKVMEEMLPVAEGVGHPRLEDFRRFYEVLKSAR